MPGYCRQSGGCWRFSLLEAAATVNARQRNGKHQCGRLLRVKSNIGPVGYVHNKYRDSWMILMHITYVNIRYWQSLKNNIKTRTDYYKGERKWRRSCLNSFALLERQMGAAMASVIHQACHARARATISTVSVPSSGNRLRANTEDWPTRWRGRFLTGTVTSLNIQSTNMNAL